eukprot:scaffold5787_cov157-Amphora_coffeaeformis.AAC.3
MMVDHTVRHGTRKRPSSYRVLLSWYYRIVLLLLSLSQTEIPSRHERRHVLWIPVVVVVVVVVVEGNKNSSDAHNLRNNRNLSFFPKDIGVYVIGVSMNAERRATKHHGSKDRADDRTR